MHQRTASLLEAGAESSSGELRIDLLGAQVIGIAFVCHILRAGALAAMPADDLAQSLAPIVFHQTVFEPAVDVFYPLTSARGGMGKFWLKTLSGS